MGDTVREVYQGGCGEIVEKKSRFIATVFPVKEQEEALAAIEGLRRQYWDATHNCFAYVVGAKNEIQRFSDDGEPQKTAGMPILDVLEGEELHNTLIVVTRYFGGTLLGTGGLVRAYQKAAREGLKYSTVIEKIPGRILRMRTDYNGLGKIQHALAGEQVPITDTIYTDQVEIEAVAAQGDAQRIQKRITELTNGRAEIDMESEVYFARLDRQVLLFDIQGKLLREA